MDLFTPDENIGHSYSQRGSRDDFDDDEDNYHESEEDEFPGEITHERKKVQVMRDEWRERATLQDRCKGHADGTDLGHDLTDLRENTEIDTFDYNGYKPPKGKSIAHKWIAAEKLVYISLDIESGGENCGIIQLSAQIFRMVQHNK